MLPCPCGRMPGGGGGSVHVQSLHGRSALHCLSTTRPHTPSFVSRAFSAHRQRQRRATLQRRGVTARGYRRQRSDPSKVSAAEHSVGTQPSALQWSRGDWQGCSFEAVLNLAGPSPPSQMTVTAAPWDAASSGGWQARTSAGSEWTGSSMAHHLPAIACQPSCNGQTRLAAKRKHASSKAMQAARPCTL